MQRGSNFMAGIYIHIPFCKQACYYCDFHFSTSTDNRNKMVDSIIKELSIQKSYLENQPVDTIYFGGGTPSILDAKEIDSILDTVVHHYSVSPNPEITLEANPDDLGKEKLQELRKAGVNRLSIGIQSFDDTVLKFLHRAHDALGAIDSVKLSREAGFENISIDLIYAIPGQSHEQWIKNIEQALLLKPEHLSAYSLTVEEKTVFGQWKKKNKITEVDDQIAAEQLEVLMNMLAAAGMEQYEVSNFCLPGFYSQHNSSYWKQTHYLGLGPGAHSYNGISRQYNISNNPLYIKALDEGKVPFEKEILTKENKINEYIFTTLRTTWGCDLNILRGEYQFDLETVHATPLKFLLDAQLIEKKGSVIRLTKKGILLADKISSDLFADS